MSDSDLLQRTRKFLLGLSALMFGATIVELIFAKHTGELVQLIPFLCCFAGLATLGLIWKRPDARAMTIHRGVMGVIVIASLFGIFEHFWGAMELTREFHPGLNGLEFWRTVLTSSVPILAPGALAATAFIGLIATYGLQFHPQLAAQPTQLRRA